MSTIKLPAASGGGSISIKGPASSGSDVDLLDTNGNLKLSDSDELRLGTGDDLKIYHNGSHSYITNATGKIFLQAKSGEHSIECEPDESVKLYYNNSKKLETLTTGISVEGSIRIGGSAAANEFDDYEEGTFTPGITFGGNSAGMSFDAQVGFYTKIGNRMFVNCYIDLSAKGSSSGVAKMTGLPVSSSSTTNAYNPMAVVIMNHNLNITHQFFSWVQYGDNVFRLYRGNFDNLDEGDFGDDVQLSLSGHYFV